MSFILWPDDTARTRKTDPVTSHEAGDSNNVAASQQAVLAEFRKVDFGYADFELQVKLGGQFSPERIRTARHELAEKGVLEFAGIYRMTRSNRRAQVWWLT